MDRFDTRALFDRAAPAYGQVGPDLFGYFGSRVVAMLSLASDDQLLDVACGTGAVLKAASTVIDSSGRLVGIDLSEAMATAARMHDTEVAVMDAQRLGFVDHSFDAISSNFALTYFEEPSSVLSEWRRVLRPGGRLGLVVHDGWWWQDDPLWGWHRALTEELNIDPQTRRRFTNPDAVAAVTSAAGFTGISVGVEPFVLRWANAEEWWHWCWSHGYRVVLEGLNTETLANYRDASLGRLGAGEITSTLPVILAHARTDS